MTKIEINPQIFKWARQELNLSYTAIAENLKRGEDEIEKWESGEDCPTYAQLEKLAYKIFQIPIATFFLSEPPDDISIKRNFRSLPDYLLELTSYRSLLAIKKAEFLRTVLFDIYVSNPSSTSRFKDITVNDEDDPSVLAAKIRSELGISLSRQKTFKSKYDAFNYYRESIEEFGIFTFQLKLEGDRAFCIDDDEFPIIVVNSGDAISSKIFSLFHELVHIILNSNSILKDYSTDFYKTNKTEVYCNKVTSEVLIPTSELLSHQELTSNDFRWTENSIKKISNDFAVSREVILRKLLDLGFATEAQYRELKQKWDSEFLNRDGGGNYYANKISALGRNFILKILDTYSKGRITDSQMRSYLDIKISNIPSLETNLI